MFKELRIKAHELELVYISKAEPEKIQWIFHNGAQIWKTPNQANREPGFYQWNAKAKTLVVASSTVKDNNWGKASILEKKKFEEHWQASEYITTVDRGLLKKDAKDAALGVNARKVKEKLDTQLFLSDLCLYLLPVRRMKVFSNKADAHSIYLCPEDSSINVEVICALATSNDIL
jgi:hypothetical protein